MKRAFWFWIWLLALMASAVATARQMPEKPRAAAPPMGWNSWDAYGFTITEREFMANASILARMRPLGWNTAVIDEGWYMANPLGKDLAERQYRYDAYGRLMPDVARFPSARDGNGLKELAKWTHSQGLKFGIHIIRGIPKSAVRSDAPIAGSSYRAPEAADVTDTCPWDDANYGVADNAAGQAWYDALILEYARWGVDFLKVDCIADHPYKGSEIRQIAQAIHRSGRPIILSLSPGPTRIEHAAQVQHYAQMWRIMDDLWDGWTFPHTNPKSEFPTGIRNAFDRLAQWNSYVARGSWPDADMLPFGSLFPHPGWGDPRESRLSNTETRAAFTLWAIGRSPLILGGNLTKSSPDLMQILMNPEVIALNQADRVSHPVDIQGLSPDLRIWVSASRNARPDTAAIFNLGESAAIVDLGWTELGLRPGLLAARNLWNGEAHAPAKRLSVTIAPHGSLLLRICRAAAASC